MVAEIGRLLVEYPEKDWQALAGRLRNPSLMDDVAAAIEEAAAMATKSVGKAKKVERKRRGNVLAQVARHDILKAEKLSALKLRLTDKRQGLPLAHIRGLANSLGMKEQLPSRRDQAVNQIVAYLAGKSTAEIDAVLSTAMPPPTRQGEEYDRWVNLILGKDDGRGHTGAEG